MGKTTLKNMLKTGKGLKIYTIKAEDLKTFSKEAKHYGILYCALTSKKEEKIDGTVDLMVREEDASRVNRIAEKFNFTKVDITAIEHDLEREKEAKEKGVDAQEISEKSAVEIMADDLLGISQEKIQDEQEMPINEQELEEELIKQIQNPSNAQKLFTENESQLEPLSNIKKKEEKIKDKIDNGKKSVRAELNAIVTELEEKESKQKEQEKFIDQLVTKDKLQNKSNKQKNSNKAQYKQRSRNKGKRYKMPKHLVEK